MREETFLGINIIIDYVLKVRLLRSCYDGHITTVVLRRKKYVSVVRISETLRPAINSFLMRRMCIIFYVRQMSPARVHRPMAIEDPEPGVSDGFHSEKDTCRLAIPPPLVLFEGPAFELLLSFLFFFISPITRPRPTNFDLESSIGNPRLK